MSKKNSYIPLSEWEHLAVVKAVEDAFKRGMFENNSGERLVKRIQHADFIQLARSLDKGGWTPV